MTAEATALAAFQALPPVASGLVLLTFAASSVRAVRRGDGSLASTLRRAALGLTLGAIAGTSSFALATVAVARLTELGGSPLAGLCEVRRFDVAPLEGLAAAAWIAAITTRASRLRRRDAIAAGSTGCALLIALLLARAEAEFTGRERFQLAENKSRLRFREGTAPRRVSGLDGAFVRSLGLSSWGVGFADADTGPWLWSPDAPEGAARRATRTTSPPELTCVTAPELQLPWCLPSDARTHALPMARTACAMTSPTRAACRPDGAGAAEPSLPDDLEVRAITGAFGGGACVAREDNGAVACLVRLAAGETWVDVDGFQNAVALASSTESACAIDASRDAWCWRKLGPGDAALRATKKIAAVERLAVADGHACATVAGRLFCWGENDWGELADGSTTASDAPVRGLVTDVVDVVVDETHTCTADASGRVTCFGRGLRGFP